ncbi:MAG: hypothetical protein R3E32_26705 [Chitinophagales bacterium]
MKIFKTIQILTLFLFFSLSVFAQLGINTDGTDPNSSAMLDVKSTDKGVLIPRMTETQKNGISVAAAQEGLMVYQTDGTKGFYYYDGTSWQQVGGSGGSGDNLGNHVATQPLTLVNMTTTQRDAISNPQPGMQIYNSTIGRLEFFQELPPTTFLNITNNGNTENGCTSIAQSFKVNSSFFINEILAKVDFGGNTGDVTLKIFNSDGTGGAELFSETFSFASIPVQNGNEYNFVLSNPYLTNCCPTITFEITQVGNTNMTAHIDFQNMVSFDLFDDPNPDAYVEGKFYKNGVNSDATDQSNFPTVIFTRRDLHFKITTQRKQWTQ